MSDDPKILGFPKAEEVPPEERAHRLKTEVDELARKPETEWLYYLERGEIAKKHGIETAALKKDDRGDDQGKREKSARKIRPKIGSAYSASRRTRLRLNESGRRSRRGPIKRLPVSKKKKIALSRRL
jgi:hypothetical protein